MMLTSKLWITYVFFLVFSIAYLHIYPLQVYAAIWNFDLARGVFCSAFGCLTQIFAFTMFGAVLSVVLMTYWIVRQEGNKIRYIPLALGVAYIATISTTMWYEQLYANVWDAAHHASTWYVFYYMNPDTFLYVVMVMSLVLVAYPWMRRANLKFVAVFALLTVVFFAAWYEVGFGYPVESPLFYFLNGASRIASHLAISFTVAGKRQFKLHAPHRE